MSVCLHGMATRRPASRSAEPAPKPHRASNVTRALDDYQRAWRWRRAVEGGLRSLELTFTQWLVLDATARAIGVEGDAVSQSDVARLCELDRMTVSQVMKTLSDRGLVDRSPSAEGRAYRIFLTRRGQRTLAQAEDCVTAATSA